MPKKTSNISSLVVAWWLSGDDECPHCGRMYAYELEFRCSECDGPGCPHCRLTHTEGHVICPDCIPESATNRPRFI